MEDVQGFKVSTGDHVNVLNKNSRSMKVAIVFEDGASVSTVLTIGHRLEFTVGTIAADIIIDDVDPPYDGLSVISKQP